MRCRKRFSLLDAPCGRCLRVQSVTGDEGLRSRLCAMGITPGTEVKVCGGKCGCGRRIRVRGSSFILGDPAAASIVCEMPFAEEEDEEERVEEN